MNIKIDYLAMRKVFAWLVIAGMVPASISWSKATNEMVAARPGFDLTWSWPLFVVMGIAMFMWAGQGCKDLKEGYVLLYGGAAVSVISCFDLGGMWLLLGWFIGILTMVGNIVYFVSKSIDAGRLEPWIVTPEYLVVRFFCVTTVLVTFATVRMIGWYSPNVLGITFAVLVSIFTLLTVLSSWRNNFSNNLAPVIITMYMIGVASTISLGLWPIALFVVGVTVMLSVLRG